MQRHSRQQPGVSQSLADRQANRPQFAVWLILGVTTLMVFAAQGLRAAGAITFDQAEFNFGQIPVNSVASHTYWIHSTGTDTVVIDTVIPGCGCTTIPLSAKTLAPGDSVAFEVVFDSKGLIGSVAKRPGLKLRGDTTLQAVKFYASVVTKEEQYFPLAIMPPVFTLPEIEARAGDKFPFQLHNLSDEDVSISIVDYPAELFAVDLPDSIAAGETITGHFSLLPEYPAGEDIYKSITFEVNHSQLYRLTAPIMMKSVKPTPVASDTSGGSEAGE